MPAHAESHAQSRLIKVETETPDKYAQKLEAVEPTVHDRIEVEILQQVPRLLTDAHRQLEEQSQGQLVGETDDGRE